MTKSTIAEKKPSKKKPGVKKTTVKKKITKKVTAKKKSTAQNTILVEPDYDELFKKIAIIEKKITLLEK